MSSCSIHTKKIHVRFKGVHVVFERKAIADLNGACSRLIQITFMKIQRWKEFNL